MHLANYPTQRSRAEYQAAIGRMLVRLREHGSIASIYQIGSVGCPGISDIDLVVVFEDGADCSFSPLQGLSSDDRYLFTHSLFGIHETTLKRIRPFNLFHNYSLIEGEDVLGGHQHAEPSTSTKKQIALEYLVRMLVNVTVANHQGLLDVRSVLLQSHAIRYDLEFLNVNEGPLFEQVAQVVRWRKQWFESAPSEQQFIEWYQRFDRELFIFLGNCASQVPFYLPNQPGFSIGRSISIRNKPTLSRSVRGIALPQFLTKRNLVLQKISQRFTRFNFDVPWRHDLIPPDVQLMFDTNACVRNENAKRLPHFYSLTSSLHLN